MQQNVQHKKNQRTDLSYVKLKSILSYNIELNATKTKVRVAQRHAVILTYECRVSNSYLKKLCFAVR